MLGVWLGKVLGPKEGGIMSELMTLITMCKTALSRGHKVGSTYRKGRLTEEEKQLLVAAFEEMGTFHFCSIEAIPGAWIRAGSKRFLDKKDHTYNARYLEAFQSLCERGYVEHRTGKLFVLTGFGYEKATRLSSG